MEPHTLLLPSSYFPPISWMASYQKASTIQIEKWETYPKQTIRNRCYILTPNGSACLSVPVVKTSGNHSLTRQISLFNGEAWRRKHFRAIASAYNKSPYFQFYRHHFDAFFEQDFQGLIELNESSILLILKILKMQPKHSYTDVWVENRPHITDLRKAFQQHPLGSTEAYPAYYQVFSDRQPFIPDLSMLDLLFNLGPESVQYLDQLPDIIQDKQF